MKQVKIVLSLAIVIGAMMVASVPVAAQEFGGGSVQAYAADSRLDNGSIVELTGENSNRVKIATQAEQQNMFGVVVDRNQLTIAISNDGIQNETFVAVSGTYRVLVSTQNGNIEQGDYITLSSINGVAMKAGSDEVTVFGRANEPFNGTGITLGTTSLQDVDGNNTGPVVLGSIPVTIDIRSNPNRESTEVNVPEVLRRVGVAIAEKEVSPVRIYLSIGVATVSIVAAIAILYAGVRNGVISIGRNPMSKKTIFRSLIEVILTSILILIIGLFAVYLLLRL